MRIMSRETDRGTHIPLEALEHGHILGRGFLLVIALAVAVRNVVFLPHNDGLYLVETDQSEGDREESNKSKE